MTSLEQDYAARFTTALKPAANELQRLIEGYLKGAERIDRVSVRAKSVDRFLKKAAKIGDDGQQKYSDPLNQIQDQIGARIVTFYLADVQVMAERILKYFAPIEIKELVPDTEAEFGYFGKHFILLLPSDVTEANPASDLLPQFFELQVKTLFQHAWAEASHDLAYKPSGTELTSAQKRKVAFTAAQAWGADLIFEDLWREGMMGL